MDRVSQAFVDGGACVVEGGDLHSGLRLRLAFYEATALVSEARDVPDHAAFDAALPEGAGVARLRHQGALSVVAQMREQKLGDAAIDAAFIVNVDDDGYALLTQCLAPLRALVAGGVSPGATLSLNATSLNVRWPTATVHLVAPLWERIVNLRLAWPAR